MSDYSHCCEVRYIRGDVLQASAPWRLMRAAFSPASAGGAAASGDAEASTSVAAEKWNPQQAVALYEQGANSDANPDRRLQALNHA